MNAFRAVIGQEFLPEPELYRTVLAGTLLSSEPLRIPRVRPTAVTTSTFPLLVDVPAADGIRAFLEAGQFAHVRSHDLRTMTTSAWFRILGGDSESLDLLPVHEDLVLKP